MDTRIALTDSNDPTRCIQRMKQWDPELSKGWVQFVHTLLIKGGGNLSPPFGLRSRL